MDEHEPYFVTIEETLVGRKAGTAASRKARDLRAADPIGTVRDRLLRRRSDERAWRKGAFGERVVGWWLRNLPDGWHVFNDVPVGVNGANIDHVAIGPPGVFTINAKNLSGKVAVRGGIFLQNGRRRDYFQKARDEAARASRLLAEAIGRPVEVRPMLAVIAKEITVDEQTDAQVTGPRGANRWLLRQPGILSPSDVRMLQAAAAKPSTWSRAWCRCGGEFIERTRRSDGHRFLGCSNFPACRQTRPPH